MHLSELLNEDAVSLSLRARDKESAIKELVQLLESAHRVDTKGEILSKVLQRESMMSTGIGNGVAIPHGKTRLLDQLVASCGVSLPGIVRILAFARRPPMLCPCAPSDLIAHNPGGVGTIFTNSLFASYRERSRTTRVLARRLLHGCIVPPAAV